MAFFSTLARGVAKTGLLGAGAQAYANTAPKGTGAKVAQTIANTGQKLRLPELGVSEAFGNYVPPPPPRYIPPQQDNLSGSRASGSNNTSGGGNAGGGGGNPQPQQQGGQPDFSQYAPEQPSIDYDALIAPALQALEGAIAPLQQGFESYKGEQQAGLQTKVEGSQADIAGQKQTLEQGRSRQGQMGTSAIDEARRQFAEIQQGLQARYGGTTGTGQFASEIAGRETLGNIAKVREGLSQAMLEIDNKLQQVQEVGRIAIQDLNQQTEARIGEAKRSLDNQIVDIRKEQGMLQAQKAQMAAQAIQAYQTSVNQYKAQQAQFQQDLYTRQYQAELDLKAALSKGRQTAESFKLYNLSSGGQTTPVRIGSQGTIQGLGGAKAPAVGPGSAIYDIGTQKDDDLTNPWNNG